jgi:hypothetical protein
MNFSISLSVSKISSVCVCVFNMQLRRCNFVNWPTFINSVKYCIVRLRVRITFRSRVSRHSWRGVLNLRVEALIIVKPNTFT